MAWIESHQAIERHPKTIELMTRMGWDLDTTVGKLHRLWWWCVDYAEDGDLRKHNDARIGAAVGLNGEASKRFIEAMVASGWIDRKPYFRVHDWWDHIGLFLQSKYKRYPDKWKRVRGLYQGNRSSNRSRNGCVTANQPNQPNRTKPTDRTPPSSSPSAKILPLEAFDEAMRDESFKAQLIRAYPAVPLEAELEKMRAWIRANPEKAKKNWRRFAQNWASKAQHEQEAQRGRGPIQEDPGEDRAAKLDALTEHVDVS